MLHNCNPQTESDGTNSTTYTWDAQDRLSSASMPGGPNISYGYDADGRRVSQTVGSMVTSYLWDEFSTYGDVVYETNGTQTISYVLGHDRLISQRVNGTASYFLQDGQGSTRALTDVTGNVTDTYDYTAFGELYAQTGTTPNSYLYTGQRFDAATEQYYLRAREYDPVVGRFLSRDKATSNFYPQNPSDQCSGVGACGLGIALNGSRTTAFNELNRYVYAAANPINAFDPSGYMADYGLTLDLAPIPTIPSGFTIGKGIFWILILTLVALNARINTPPQFDPPDGKICGKMMKLLKEYKRLCEKKGVKISDKRLKELNDLRDAGQITAKDLPGTIQGEFPDIGRLGAFTLHAIEQWCSKK